MFKEMSPNQSGSSVAKVMIEGGTSSQGVKPTCARCGKKYFGKCLAGTGCCFSCGKDGHKVRHCPTIAVGGREAKQVPPYAPDVGTPKSNHFYILHDKAYICHT